MAEYLIQDTTLEGIADAIRAKTGSSASMTPAQMPTEIASIPTGGGVTTQPLSVTENGTYTAPSGMAYTPVTVNVPSSGGGLELLADYTASEDVSAIKIDFTASMLGYTHYIVEMNARFTGSSTPYIGLNTETANRYYSQLTSSYIYSAMIYVYDSARAALVGGSATQTYSLPIEYLHIRAFNENSVIRSGANVKIWGVAE